MARQICRYNLSISLNQGIQMPVKSTVLTAQMYEGKLCLCVQVNNIFNPVETRKFSVFRDGDFIPGQPSKYVAAVQAGELYFVYEMLPLPWS